MINDSTVKEFEEAGCYSLVSIVQHTLWSPSWSAVHRMRLYIYSGIKEIINGISRERFWWCMVDRR
jgi:hypothetical protein